MPDVRGYRGRCADSSHGLEGKAWDIQAFRTGRVTTRQPRRRARSGVLAGGDKDEGFRPVSNEVIFVDMSSSGNDDEHEPLLGYVILEQVRAAVDMLNHRLVPVKYIDMK